MWRRSRTQILLCIVILVYFALLTGPGLLTPLRPDELDFLHSFTLKERWIGGLVLKAVQALAQDHALPYRLVSYALVLLNAALGYRLAVRLSGNREIGFCTALLFCYHHRLGDLFTRVTAPYESLGVLFVLLLLNEWIERRGNPRYAFWMPVPLAYFIAGYYCTGLVVAAPLLAMLYELVYHRRATPRQRSLSWGLLAVTIALATMIGSRGRLNGDPGFHAHFTSKQWLFSQRHYLDELVCSTAPVFKDSYVYLLYGALLAFAGLSSSRVIRFAVGWVILAPLPMLLLPARGFYMMDLAWFGWSLLLAAFVIKARDWLLERVWYHPPIPDGVWQPERLFTAAAFMFLMAQGAFFDHHHREDFRLSKRLWLVRPGDLRDLEAFLPSTCRQVALELHQPVD